MKPLSYANLLSKKGVGLLEVLALAGLGLVIGMGLLNISKNSLQNSKVISTDLAEQDLEHSLIQILNDEEDCKWNLRPDNLSNKTAGKGQLRDTNNDSKLVKTKGNNTSAPPPNTDDDITLVKLGDFRGALNIVKMEFIIPDPSEQTKRSLRVYYSKKGLDQFNTYGGGACVKGTGANDQAGCYFKACKVDYSFSGTTVNNCTFTKCENQGVSQSINVSGRECAGNKYLRGFDNNGKKICEDISPCPAGHAFRGFKADGSKLCMDVAKCSDNQVFKGFKSDGRKICEPVLKSKSCPKGQYITGLDREGNVTCTVVCTAGRSWNKNESACKCPEGSQWNGLKCVSNNGGEET